VKRTFRCMYHALAYDLEGKLVAAPNLVKMPDIDRTEFGLRPVHVRECANAASPACRRAPTPAAAYWSPASPTSAPSTTGSGIGCATPRNE
jgi:phenylpropionate dioxygenase-like ring-hydroxylating dioxygenase large terminal subunit